MRYSTLLYCTILYYNDQGRSSTAVTLDAKQPLESAILNTRSSRSPPTSVPTTCKVTRAAESALRREPRTERVGLDRVASFTKVCLHGCSRFFVLSSRVMRCNRKILQCTFFCCTGLLQWDYHVCIYSSVYLTEVVCPETVHP